MFLLGYSKTYPELPKPILIIQAYLGFYGVQTSAWRFMGSEKWGYKSPNMGCKYSYPTYNPAYV